MVRVKKEKLNETLSIRKSKETLKLEPKYIHFPNDKKKKSFELKIICKYGKSETQRKNKAKKFKTKTPYKPR